MANNLRGILEILKKEVIFTKTRAGEVTESIQQINRQTEALKIVFLQRYVEQLKQTAARDKGMTSLFRDRKKVKASFLVGAGSFLLGALISRKLSDATFAGISGLDGMVKRLGESTWCLTIGKKISVVPEDMIPAGASWIPLNSLYIKLRILHRRSIFGESLGTLDGIVSKLN